MRKGDRLFQVNAPHFCAGFIVSDCGICMKAAPIIQWAVNRSLSYLLRYFIQGKNYEVIDCG